MTCAETLAGGLRCGYNEDIQVVERWGSGFGDGAQDDGGRSERIGAPYLVKCGDGEDCAKSGQTTMSVGGGTLGIHGIIGVGLAESRGLAYSLH